MKLNLPKIKKINLPIINIPKTKPLPKPKVDMKALQKSVGYITDIISIVPFVRPVITGVKVGLNVAIKGESSKYLKDDQKSNSGWNMAPGGSLLQRSLNDITEGKSRTWIQENTIDLNKISLEQVNKLPPKYYPTKILPFLLQETGKNTLSRPIEMLIKPSLLPNLTRNIYKFRSTIGFNRRDSILDQGIKLAVMPQQNVLPPYTRVSIDKEIIASPTIEIQEAVSTISLSNQPQILIPKIDKFNRLINETKVIPIKIENIDMTIPIMTICGIVLILYTRR